MQMVFKLAVCLLCKIYSLNGEKDLRRRPHTQTNESALTGKNPNLINSNKTYKNSEAGN